MEELETYYSDYRSNEWEFSIERTGYTWTLKWIGDDTIYEEKQGQFA